MPASPLRRRTAGTPVVSSTSGNLKDPVSNLPLVLDPVGCPSKELTEAFDRSLFRQHNGIPVILYFGPVLRRTSKGKKLPRMLVVSRNAVIVTYVEPGKGGRVEATRCIPVGQLNGLNILTGEPDLIALQVDNSPTPQFDLVFSLERPEDEDTLVQVLETLCGLAGRDLQRAHAGQVSNMKSLSLKLDKPKGWKVALTPGAVPVISWLEVNKMSAKVEVWNRAATPPRVMPTGSAEIPVSSPAKELPAPPPAPLSARLGGPVTRFWHSPGRDSPGRDSPGRDSPPPAGGQESPPQPPAPADSTRERVRALRQQTDELAQHQQDHLQALDATQRLMSAVIAASAEQSPATARQPPQHGPCEAPVRSAVSPWQTAPRDSAVWSAPPPPPPPPPPPSPPPAPVAPPWPAVEEGGDGDLAAAAAELERQLESVRRAVGDDAREKEMHIQLLRGTLAELLAEGPPSPALSPPRSRSRSAGVRPLSPGAARSPPPAEPRHRPAAAPRLPSHSVSPPAARRAAARARSLDRRRREAHRLLRAAERAGASSEGPARRQAWRLAEQLRRLLEDLGMEAAGYENELLLEGSWGPAAERSSCGSGEESEESSGSAPPPRPPLSQIVPAADPAAPARASHPRPSPQQRPPQGPDDAYAQWYQQWMAYCWPHYMQQWQQQQAAPAQPGQGRPAGRLRQKARQRPGGGILPPRPHSRPHR